MSDYEWDDNDLPLAYLITIRTFGSWLHGDQRESVDRHGRNVFGSERIKLDPMLSTKMSRNIAGEEFLLNGQQRPFVEKAIREVCRIRGYQLAAINVRTNHAHAVVSAGVRPESIINAFKANATRELRERGVASRDVKIWSRGGSRKYLWKPQNVDAAIDYVLYGQGGNLPNF